MAIWTRESSAMSTTNQYIKYRVKVTLNSQSVANNTSNVTVQVLVWRTNQGYTTYGNGTCYCKIDGTTYTASITTSQKFTYNSDTVVFSRTINIKHNSDGSKRLNIEARIDHNRFNSSPSWQSYSTNLNTIPRASKVSLSTSSQNLGSSITIYTNRASSSFTHVIKYKLGNASGTIGSNVGNSVTWTLPNSLANQITTSTSKSGTITCETYSGSTKIGTSSVTFTAIVPNNSTFNPSIGDMTHSEANNTIKNAIGLYVQKHSRLNIGFSGASAKYGATIKSYKIEFDGKTYNSSSATTGVINGSGNLTIKGTITDSRGRTATKTVTINVLAYSPPKITTLTVFRCDSNGNKDPKGEYISVRRAGTGTSLNGRNQLTIVIKTKPRASSTWTTKDTTTTTSGSFDATKVFGGYNTMTTYDVRVEVTDKLTKTPVALNKAVPTEQVAMSWGKTGIGVGKIWERGALDVGGTIYGDGDVIVNDTPIVESGSNNDGYYVKYYDGTMICVNRKVIKGSNLIEINGATNVSEIKRSRLASQPYPATFVNCFYSDFKVLGSTSVAMRSYVIGTKVEYAIDSLVNSNTQWRGPAIFHISETITSSDDILLIFFAIGRWK